MTIKIPFYAAKLTFARIISGSTQHSTSTPIMQGNCPLCGDKKRRMYMKDYGNSSILIYCHNCGYSRSFYNFLKDYYPAEINLLQEHLLQSVVDGTAFKRNTKDKVKNLVPFSELDVKLRMYLSTRAFKITEVQTDDKKEKYRNHVVEYFKDRHMSKSFSDDIFCVFSGPLKGYAGIPFYDKTGVNLIHVQGRRMFTPKTKELENWNPKYKFLRDAENGIEIENKPIWGSWKVDSEKVVIIVEGTLDADAFGNSIATCGATISEEFIQGVQKMYPNRIWCPDNYWLDAAGNRLTTALLNMDESCLVFPKDSTYKDSNEMVKSLNIDRIDREFIRNNVYDGRMGLAKLLLATSTRKEDIISYDANEKKI